MSSSAVSELAIRAEGLGKTYRIGEQQAAYRTLRDSISGFLPSILRRRAPDDTRIFEALRDVSFEVKQGEVVGLIGHNGAGKSTLLKILARITSPTRGHAELHGRLASLLEVGTGFHPELTGRENIYLNAAILGMPRTETLRKFDEIVAFSEVERFIDTPVKHYSSGMSLRLAFAVAAHLETDVILVDEVLAVGDARFQKKCLNKMQDVSQQGRTVIFVSHNMPSIARLCERVMLLQAGRLVQDGPSAQVIGAYLKGDSGTTAGSEWSDPAKAPGGEIARLCAIRVRDEGGAVAEALDVRHPFTVEIEYEVVKPGTALAACFSLVNSDGIEALSAVESDPRWRRVARPAGRYVARATVPGNLLAEGTFFVSAGVFTVRPNVVQFYVRDVVSFRCVDPLEGDSARGDYEGRVDSVIHPLLQWTNQTGCAT
jgi:lipopolysaccharide transport system ATP-binding protein